MPSCPPGRISLVGASVTLCGMTSTYLLVLQLLLAGVEAALVQDWSPLTLSQREVGYAECGRLAASIAAVCTSFLQAPLRVLFHSRQHHHSCNGVTFAPAAAFVTEKPELSSFPGCGKSPENRQLYCVGTMKLTTCEEEEQFLRNRSRSSSNRNLELALHRASCGLGCCRGGELLSKGDVDMS
jgi:hypothetical protein